jgi:hypothetical protein
VPHQLCHFHYLREAALPIFEADRHAKKEVKKTVRGDRAEGRGPERRGGADRAGLLCGGAQRPDRSALTDDGPLEACGCTIASR